MTEADTAGILGSVLTTLLAEEQELADLIELAIAEQRALVASDYAEITRVSEAMLVAASGLDVLEHRRESLLQGIGQSEATLDQLLPLADEAGVVGFGAARLALVARANELRQAQEQNARLLLSAMRMQEKWFAMFGALASPTYGARGQQEQVGGERFVSRSA